MSQRAPQRRWRRPAVPPDSSGPESSRPKFARRPRRGRPHRDADARGRRGLTSALALCGWCAAPGLATAAPPATAEDAAPPAGSAEDLGAAGDTEKTDGAGAGDVTDGETSDVAEPASERDPLDARGGAPAVPTGALEGEEVPPADDLRAPEAMGDGAGMDPPAQTDIAAAEPDPAAEDPGETATTEDVRNIVVGSMFDVTHGVPRIVGSAHLIDSEQLETYESDDIHQVITTVPGVYIRGEDGFGLRPNIGLRGANSDRSSKVTLMEDGILLGPAPYAAPAAYYFPLPTRMVGVEVFKGPAAVRFGPNTIGGAINLRTREIPTSPEVGVDLAGGRFGYGKAHAWAGTTWKGFGVLAEVGRVQSRGFKELDGGGDTGFGKTDSMLKLGYRTSPHRRVQHVVELKGGFATERSHETYLGLSRDDFERNPYRRYAASQRGLMAWWRTQAEATYVVSDGDTLELETRVYRHDFDRSWEKLNRFAGGPDLSEILTNPTSGQNAVYFAILRGEEDSTADEETLQIGTNHRTYVSQGVSSTLRWTPEWEKVAQQLELGVRVHNDHIVRDHTEDPFVMTQGTLLRAGDTEETTQNRGDAIATAMHVHDAVTIVDRFTIAPGLRVEYVATSFDDRLADRQTSRVDVVALPGLGLHVMATEWLAVYGGVHRGFSPVAPGQDESIQPEFSVNYELGSRVNWRGLAAEATGFFNDYSNLTGNCTFSSGCADAMIDQQDNAGRVWVYGLESTLDYRHRFDSGIGLGGGARYTYTGSSFRTSFSSPLPQFGDVSAGDSLAYVPVHLVGGDAWIGGGRWDLNVRGSYTGAMRDVPGRGAIAEAEEVPGFFVLDVAAEVRALDVLSVYGLLNNATGNDYIASLRPFGARPGAPLTFILGVKVHWQRLDG